jgi:hypothetical protein
MSPWCCPATPNISSALPTVFPYVSSALLGIPQQYSTLPSSLGIFLTSFQCLFFIWHPSMFSKWSPIAKKIVPWCLFNVAQHPRHLLSTTQYRCHFFNIPPSPKNIFSFLHPLPSSHHPLNLTRHLQTFKKMTKLRQGRPLGPRDVPKKKKDAGNPGYLSCGFFF